MQRVKRKDMVRQGFIGLIAGVVAATAGLIAAHQFHYTSLQQTLTVAIVTGAIVGCASLLLRRAEPASC